MYINVMFQNFQTGDVNVFLMKTQYHLGTPVYVRVWHDCSGEDSKQGWHLSKIVIVDRSDGQWYLFLCNKWLALDEDDAMTSRLLRVAGKDYALGDTVMRDSGESEDPLDCFNGSFIEFVDAFETGRAPIHSGEEGRRSVALIEECRKAPKLLQRDWEAWA